MAVKLLKFVIALALIPLVAGEIWTLIDLARAAATSGPEAPTGRKGRAEVFSSWTSRHPAPRG